MITDEMVEAALAIASPGRNVVKGDDATWQSDVPTMATTRAALEAVLPMIRAAVLEEAAMVADDACVEPSNTRDVDALIQELAGNDKAEFIAWTIRAMKGDKP